MFNFLILNRHPYLYFLPIFKKGFMLVSAISTFFIFIQIYDVSSLKCVDSEGLN